MISLNLVELLIFIIFVKADGCNNPCGSAANSPKPFNDMNKMLQNAPNCMPPQQNASPYAPLAPTQSASPSSPCSPSYAPSQQQPQQQPPQQFAPPPSVGGDQQCEYTTTLACNLPPNQPPMEGGGMPSSVGPSMPQNMPPSSQQQCDCPPQQQQPQQQPQPQPQPQQQQPQQFNPQPQGNMPCECNQGPGQGMMQPPMQSMPPASQAPSSPSFCQPSTSPGSSPSSPFAGGNRMTPQSDPYECKASPQPINTVKIGNVEMPAADNFQYRNSSCAATSPCG